MATKTFNGVTPAAWERMKAQSASEHGTVYDSPDGARGTAKTSTPIGELVLRFAYDAAKQSVTYEIDKKPFILAEGTVWSGVQGAIDKSASG